VFFIQTTRGTGADVIIIDEVRIHSAERGPDGTHTLTFFIKAAHIDPQLFYQTILPILQMKNTALLCLSSPEGDDNYYSQLLNLRDPILGGPFFRVVECFMICKDCQKLGKCFFCWALRVLKDGALRAYEALRASV